MVNLHYFRNGADTVGSTVGAIEAIGTYQVPSKSTAFHGWWFMDTSSSTTTTAEGTNGKFLVDSPDITHGTQTFLAGAGTGEGAGTNESSTYDPGYMVLYQPKGNFKNATLTYSYDIVNEMTQENYASVFTMWSSDGVTPDAIFRNRGHPTSGLNTIIKHSRVASDIDIYDNAIEVMAETITLPSDARRVVAMMVCVKSDAIPTDGEHFAGHIAVTATLTGIEPMHIPLPHAGNAIGTQVDWPDQGNSNWIYPMCIDLTGSASETFTFTVNLAAVVTAAYVVSVNLLAI